MKYPRFFAYNVVGGVAWVAICLTAGLAFGQMPWVKTNFEYVMVAIIVISLLPMAVEFFLARRRAKAEPPPAALPPAPPALDENAA